MVRMENYMQADDYELWLIIQNGLLVPTKVNVMELLLLRSQESLKMSEEDGEECSCKEIDVLWSWSWPKSKGCFTADYLDGLLIDKLVKHYPINLPSPCSRRLLTFQFCTDKASYHMVRFLVCCFISWRSVLVSWLLIKLRIIWERKLLLLMVL